MIGICPVADYVRITGLLLDQVAGIEVAIDYADGRILRCQLGGFGIVADQERPLDVFGYGGIVDGVESVAAYVARRACAV